MSSQTVTEQSEFGRNIYVASLPVEFDDEQLFNLFAPYGPISSARVMRAKGTRQSKGYGFVLYKNASSADMAISALVGHVVDGNRIQVRLAHPDASVAYSGQRSSRSGTSTPKGPPAQAPTPPLPPMLPQPGGSPPVMAAYAASALYPALYPPAMPPPPPQPLVSPAPSAGGGVPGFFSPQVMLVPQYASQVQQAANQATYYIVLPDGGSALA